MPTNDIKPFATGGGANVVTQSAWAADPVVGTGFQSGICPSAKYNKALRQATFVCAGIGNFLNSKGYDLLDNTDLTTLTNNMIAAWAAGVTTTNTVTLTNKTMSGSSNTFTNIGNGSLVNSSVTIGATSVSLGATASTIDHLTLTASQTPTAPAAGNDLTNKTYVDLIGRTLALETGITAAATIGAAPTIVGGFNHITAGLGGDDAVTLPPLPVGTLIPILNTAGGTINVYFTGGWATYHSADHFSVGDGLCDWFIVETTNTVIAIIRGVTP